MTTQDRKHKLESKLAVLEAIEIWEQKIAHTKESMKFHQKLQFPTNTLEHWIDIYQRCIRRMNAKYKKL